MDEFSNREKLESFLRTASAEELIEKRRRIESLHRGSPSAIADIDRLTARIAYELRFRVPQPV